MKATERAVASLHGKPPVWAAAFRVILEARQASDDGRLELVRQTTASNGVTVNHYRVLSLDARPAPDRSGPRAGSSNGTRV